MIQFKVGEPYWPDVGHFLGSAKECINTLSAEDKIASRGRRKVLNQRPVDRDRELDRVAPLIFMS